MHGRMHRNFLEDLRKYLPLHLLQPVLWSLDQTDIAARFRKEPIPVVTQRSFKSILAARKHPF